MAFKRALWHSGLTYQTVCENCKTVVRYDDNSLDFRPWYPDGFVYCPKCKTPLRHNEGLAINPDGTPYKAPPTPELINITKDVQENVSSTSEASSVPNEDTTAPLPNEKYLFCTSCGKKYNPATDNFCSGCGKKLK